MDKRIGFISAVALLLLIGFSNSLPLLEGSCASATCKSVGTKFDYKPGTSYQYQYEVNVSSSAGEGSERKSQMFLTAVAHFDVLTKCDWSLRIADVNIESSHPDEEDKTPVTNQDSLKAALENGSVRFSFQDGIIERLCQVGVEEPEWSLNIKRGILNAIQNVQERFDIDTEAQEVGVAGTCDYSYTVKMGLTHTVDVTKVRNSCQNRGEFMSHFTGVPYKVKDVPDQSSYVSQSVECVQSIHSRRFANVLCTDTVILSPTENSRAEMTFSQSLVFIQEDEVDPDVNQAPVVRRTGISLVNIAAGERLLSAEEADSLIREHCASAERLDDVSYSDIEFAKLLINKLSLKNLQNVLDKDSCVRKTLQEQLLYSHSPPSLAVVREQILSKALGKKKRKEWLRRLSRVQKPTLDHLLTVEPLLEQFGVDPDIWLSISSLAGKLCAVDGALARNEDVLRLVEKLAVPIGRDCRGSGAEVEKIVVALRSLSNAGACATSSSIVGRCYADEANDIFLRAFSLETLRVSSCTASRDGAFDIFTNQTEPTEIRIAAFHAAISCANVKLIRNIKESLGSENSTQVGSYVYTYLKSLQKSSSPSSLPLQSLIGAEEISANYESDFLKFSRNDELSFYSRDLDLGAKLESSVLFGDELFVPRIARLNVTADLFGRSFNVYEAYLRTEGFERLAQEYLYGMKDSKKEAGLYSKWNSEYRFEDLDRQYESSKKVYAGPKVAFYSRSFGEESGYLAVTNPRSFGDVFQQLVDPLRERLLPDGDFQETKFFDEALILPSIAGLPLRIGATGSAKIITKISSEGDVAATLRTGKGNIIWNIDTRVRVPLVAEIKLESPIFESGVIVSSTFETNVRTEGHLKMKSALSFDFKFSLPDDTIKLGELKTEILLSHDGKISAAKELEIPEENKHQSCIGPKDMWRWGLKLCAEAVLPDSGSDGKSFSLFLRKNDYSFKGVTLKNSAKIKEGVFHLETELGRIDGTELSAVLVLNSKLAMKEEKDEKQIEAEIKATVGPVNFDIKGDLLLTPTLKNISLAMSRTGHTALTLLAYQNAFVTPKTKSTKLVNSLAVSFGSETIEMQANLTKTEKKDILSTDLELKVVSSKFVTDVSGSAKRGVTSSSGNVQYSYRLFNAKSFGKFEVKEIDHIAVWRRIDMELLTADNKEMKNKNSYKWDHSFTDDHQSYSLEISGPNSRYTSALSHRIEVDEETFTAGFEAKDDKSSFHYEGLANLAVSSNFVSVDGRFARSNIEDFLGKVVWRKSGADLYRKDDLELELRARQNNLLKLAAAVDMKPRLDISFSVNGTLGQEAHFSCTGAVVAPQLDSIDSSAKLVTSMFKPVDLLFRYADKSDVQKALFQGKYGTNQEVSLSFMRDEKNRTGLINGGLQLPDGSYSTAASFKYGSEFEILADIHLDSQRDIWLRLSQSGNSVVSRHVGHIKWDVNKDPRQAAQIVVDQSSRQRGKQKTDVKIEYPDNKVMLTVGVERSAAGYEVDARSEIGVNGDNKIVMKVVDYPNAVKFAVNTSVQYDGLRDSIIHVSLDRANQGKSGNHSLLLRAVKDGVEQIKLTSVGSDDQLQTSRSLSEVASVAAPFLRKDPIDLILSLKRNSSGYGLNFDVKLDEEKSLTLNTNLFIDLGQEKKYVTGDIKLVTPFSTIPTVDLGLQHTSKLSPAFETRNMVFVAVNKERHELLFEVGLGEEAASYSSNLSIGSPLIGTEPVILAGSLRPSLYSPSLRLELGMPGSTMVALARVDRQTDGGISAIASLAAPFLEGNKLEIIGEYNMEEKFVLKASALLGSGRGFRFETRYFFISLKNFDVGFILRTPWEQYENGGLLVQLGMSDDFAVVNGTFVGTINTDEYSLGFFKETEDGLLRGELIVGLPKTEMLKAIGVRQHSDDDNQSVNILLEQGQASLGLKFVQQKDDSNRVVQFSATNSDMLSFANFEVIQDIRDSAATYTTADEAEGTNRTVAGALSISYRLPEADNNKFVKLRGMYAEKTEPNVDGDDKTRLSGTLDVTSSFPGVETGFAGFVHDWTVPGVLSDSVMGKGFNTDLAVTSHLNLAESKTKMEVKLTDQTTKKNQYYRITSQYEVADAIQVNGQFQSSIPKYKNIPWTIEIVKKGSSDQSATEDTEGDWNDNQYQRDEPEETPEQTPAEEAEEWSLSVKLAAKLPDKPLYGSFFMNNRTVEVNVEGPWSLIRDPAKILLSVEPSEENQFSGTAKIELLTKQYSASGLVEFDVANSFKKFSGNAVTPWKSFENADVTIEVHQEYPDTKVTSKFGWESNEMKMMLGYSYNFGYVYGAIFQASTPFENLETIDLVLRYATEEEQTKTLMKIEIPKYLSQYISRDISTISVNHESEADRKLVKVKVDSSSAVVYSNSDAKFKLDSKWDFESDEITVEIDVVVDTATIAMSLNGKASYAEDGQTSATCNLNLPELEKIDIEVDGVFMMDTSDGTMKLVKGDSLLTMKLDHKLAENENSFKTLLTLPDQEKYELITTYVNSPSDDTKSIQAQFQSPLSGLEDLDCGFLLKQNRTGFEARAEVKNMGENRLSLVASVDENSESPIKEYKGEVSLESSYEKLSKLHVSYDKKYTNDKNSEHILALTVNDLDESKWKYIKATEENMEKTREEIELEGKYIIWPVAINYLFIREYPTIKKYPVTDKRTFSIFDADEPKLRGDVHTIVETTEFGKEFSIEISKVNLTTRYAWQPSNFTHGTLLKLAPDGSRNFGYDVGLLDGSKGQKTDYKAKLVLTVPQRSIGLASTYVATGKSIGALVETSWDVTDRTRYLRVYYQLDQVDKGKDGSGKAWKLGVKQRRLALDLLVEGDLIRDPSGGMTGSSTFQYLPGDEHRLKGTVAFKKKTDWWSLDQNSTLTLTLPKAKLNTKIEQMLSANLRSLKFLSLVDHFRNESQYNSRRQLDMSRVPETTFLYKVKNPKGQFESAGQLRTADDTLFAVYNALENSSIASMTFLNYTFDGFPYFRLYSNAADEEFDLVYKWENDRSASLLTVSLGKDGITVPIEGHFALNTSHLLTSSLYWTPSLVSDIRTSFRDYRKARKDDLLYFVLQTVDDTYQEADEIIQFISGEMEEVISPFREDVTAEWQALVDDAFAVEELFEAMYEKNDFLIKTVVGLSKVLLQEYPVETIMRDFKEWLMVKQEELTKEITSKTYDFESWANDLETQIENLKAVWANHLYGPVMSAFSNLSSILAVDFRTRLMNYEVLLARVGNHLSRWLSTAASELQSTLLDFGLTVYEQVKPGFLTALDIVETSLLQLSEKLSSVFLTEGESGNGESFFEKMEKLVERISEVVKEMDLEKVWDFVDGYYEVLKRGVKEKAGNLFEHLRIVIHLAERMNSFVYEFWNDNFEVTGSLGPLVENFKGKFTLDPEFSVGDWLSNLFDKISSSFDSVSQVVIDQMEYRTEMVFIPEEGKFHLEQVLPFPWHSFNEKPDFKDFKNSQIFLEALSFLQESDQDKSFYDTLISNVERVKSPHFYYNGYASIDFYGYVSTFNGFSYELAGNCSYVLLRNFETKGSSLVVQRLPDENGASLVFTLLAGDYKVDFIPGATETREFVLIDGRPVVLPFVTDGVWVSYTAGRVTMETESLQVRCFLDRKLCQVLVKGDSVQSSAGLLGRPDAELATDRRSPAGNPVDLPEFLTSWEASSKTCSPPSQVTKKAIIKDDLCSRYFDKSAPGLANCYGVVSSVISFLFCILLLCLVVVSCILFRRRFKEPFPVGGVAALETGVVVEERIVESESSV